jgi:hypothetical protein
MSLDRFVDITRKRMPTRDSLRDVLVGYMNGAGLVRWHDETARFYVDLVGGPSDPTPGVPPEVLPEERWFEVCIGEDHVDVITRGADPYTRAVANGFAALAERMWKVKARS